MNKVNGTEVNKYDLNLFLDLHKDEVLNNIGEIREALEGLSSLAEEFNLAALHIYPTFYGCSFNFAKEGSAEAHYHNKIGDTIYNECDDDDLYYNDCSNNCDCCKD